MKLRFRAPSPALVISLVALFVALGGTTYAATSLPRNSVGTSQLENGAVTAHVEFVGSGVIGDSNCPGVGQAAAGFLCVYEVFSTNRTPITPDTLPINNHSGVSGTDPYGFVLILGSTGGSAISYGSWTVKAA